MIRTLLNKLVRFYLRYSPLTDGKRQLLRILKNLITPNKDIITLRTKHGFHLRVTLKNPEHQHIYFYGEHDERHAIKLIKKLIKKGDVCWDVGANIGFYTCLFSKLVGGNGAVVAFEPLSSAFSYLKSNIEINKLKNVRLINKAISDMKGPRTIFFESLELAEGTATLKQYGNKNITETVEVDCIDGIYKSIPLPDFIKMDVENCEIEVFKGGQKFFSSNAPIIIADLKHDDKEYLKEVETYIKRFDYSFYEIGKRSLKKCLGLPQSKKRHFILVKQSSENFNRTKHLIKD